MVSVSVVTLDVLRRAREAVEVVPVSDTLAFAVLQLQMGRDLARVRVELQLSD